MMTLGLSKGGLERNGLKRNGLKRNGPKRRHTKTIASAACLAQLSLFWALVLGTNSLWAQGPSADWRQRESEHFRWHYPAEAGAWVEDLAPRLEAIRERVSEEVGYAPEERVDVLVMDPVSRPNGSAWPMMGWPRMILWTTPPGPDSVIGHYDDWATLLAVHEEVHLAHLLRPSRNPWKQRLGSWIPLGPVAQTSPRWVSEGYATLLEGQLTAFGRPHSDIRATVLRRWAQQGELPSYGRLAADGERWMGMSMAYLMGSAYLEWLQEREGPDALRHLWRRMSARQTRSFEAAFRGVFGDSPRKLYNRFCAELTYKAMALEASMEGETRRGKLWQDLAWTSGAPSVSADGERLAMVLRSKDGPSRLVVWSTAPDDAAEAKWRKRQTAMLAKDTDDVAAVRSGPLPRKPLHHLVSGYGVRPYGPRWIGERNALLYVRFEPDREGFLVPDLYLWQPDGAASETRRLTWGAAVRDADPSPDGTWAVGIRQRFGRSELVSIELDSGQVTPLNGGDEDSVVAFPRLSPDGRRLAYVRQVTEGKATGWQLVVRELGASRGLGPARVLPTHQATRISHPEWHPDGQQLYVSLGVDGYIDLYRLSLSALEAVPMTRGQGAAIAPAPTPDGAALFYLSLEPDGLDLRRLNLEPNPSEMLPPAPIASWSNDQRQAMVPALPPTPPPTPEPFEARQLSPEQSYGWGRVELLPLIGGRITPHQETLEVGLRMGDLLGRFELLALASGTSDTFEGGALHGTWRGRPTVWRGQLFEVDEATLGSETASSFRGIELAASRRWKWRNLTGFLEGGGLWSELDSTRGGTSDGPLERRTLFTTTRWRAAQRRGDWRFFETFGLAAELGRTDQDTWQRGEGSVGLDVTRRGWGGLHMNWRRADLRSSDEDFERFRLGGVRGSLPSPFSLRQWIDIPALPPALVTAEGVTTFRVDVSPGNGPWSLFYAHYRLSESSSVDSLALRGLEFRWKRGPWPLLRLPGFELSAGAAEIQNTGFDGDMEGWLTLTFQP